MLKFLGLIITVASLTVVHECKDKCSGPWSNHACFGGNGKRSGASKDSTVSLLNMIRFTKRGFKSKDSDMPNAYGELEYYGKWEPQHSAKPENSEQSEKTLAMKTLLNKEKRMKLFIRKMIRRASEIIEPADN